MSAHRRHKSEITIMEAAFFAYEECLRETGDENLAKRAERSIWDEELARRAQSAQRREVLEKNIRLLVY